VLSGNGKEALDMLQSATFDLVLMDVQMPVMDGLEATAALRAIEATTGKHQKVIAMTALVMKGDRERCLAAGMDGYISKPIRTQELDELLEKNIVQQSAQSEAATTTAEAAVNSAELMERIGGDHELLTELLVIFQKEYPDYLRTARESLALGKIDELKRTAHTMKGSLSNLAAGAASNIAATIENDASSMSPSSAGQMINALELEIAQVVLSLDELSKETPQ
jgi:CheY-like chemotaxis protein